MKIHIETYGCSANQSDSEIMAGILRNENHEIVGKPDDSDILIINSCMVKTPTEMKILDRIRKLKREYPKKGMIIAGCMPEVMGRRLRKIAPSASLISTHHLKDMARVAGGISEGRRFEFIGKTRESKVCVPRERKNTVIGITQIATGCLSSCSYCCVRLAKGGLFSFPPEKIIQDIENSLEEGCREVWITSQDNSCYGKDINTDLPKLLSKIVKIDGKFRVRVGMMNPSHLKPFLKELIEIYRSPKIYRFVHLPVQSGSDGVLELMGRNYKVRDFKKIIREFRKSIPDITVSTDIIVGFPGETEGDFGKTISLIREIRPDIVNLSKFGARPGTMAAGMEQLDSRTIKERSKKTGKIIKEIMTERNVRFVGKTSEILVDEKGKKENQWIGRNECYKPVLVNFREKLQGKFVRVKITKAEGTHLIGFIRSSG